MFNLYMKPMEHRSTFIDYNLKSHESKRFVLYSLIMGKCILIKPFIKT